MRDKLIEEVRIASSLQRVFEAWTREALMMQWWRNDDFRTTSWEGDVHPGGHWHVRFGDPHGNRFSAQGEYLHVRSPTHLSFTWKPDWDEDPPTVIDLELRTIDGGCSMRLTQYGFASTLAYERNRYAWAATLELLRDYLERNDPEP